MSYIGNSPGVASQRVESAFTATASQTVFTPTSGYTLGYCDVYQNGVKLVNGDDYTAADGATVTLTTGAASGDSIVIVASFPRGLSDGYLKSEADAKYVAKTGSTMTGDLVLDNGNADGAQIQLASSGYSNWNLDNYSGRLRAYYGSTEYFTLNASGNLGLGVTPSAWSSSTVAVQLGNYGSLFAFKNSGNVYLNNNSYTNSVGNEIYLNTAPAGRYRITDNVHIWYNAASGTAGNAISFTQAMTLDASGNLMVGRTSTTYKLDVKGNAGIRAIDTDELRSLILTPPNSGGDAAFVESSSANGLVLRANNASGFVGFTTGGTTERARIDSSGRLLVGTTTSATGIDTGVTRFLAVSDNSNWGAAATLVGDSGGRGLRVTEPSKTIIGAFDAAVGNSAVNIGSNSSHPVRFITGGSEAARIDTSSIFRVSNTSTPTGCTGFGGETLVVGTSANSGLFYSSASAGAGVPVSAARLNDGPGMYFFRNGSAAGFINITTGAISVNNSSDYRLKENVESLSGSLAKVMKVRPVTFTWKENGSAGKSVIAHELQEIFPDVVFGEKDAINEDGSIKTQSVSLGNLVPDLIVAIQEQQAIIEQLKADIAELKGQA